MYIDTRLTLSLMQTEHHPCSQERVIEIPVILPLEKYVVDRVLKNQVGPV
jgi:hypothetical protein